MSALAEINFSTQKLNESIVRAKLTLQCIPPFHAEAARAHAILIKCFNSNKRSNKTLAVQNFDDALKVLQWHLGESHPLHASNFFSNNPGIYNIMAEYYLNKKNWDEALVLLNSSLVCCLRNLGKTHLQTAEVYIDIAKANTKMIGQKLEALKMF